MHTTPLVWAGDGSDPLIQHLCFVDGAANTVVVGTGC